MEAFLEWGRAHPPWMAMTASPQSLAAQLVGGGQSEPSVAHTSFVLTT